MTVLIPNDLYDKLNSNMFDSWLDDHHKEIKADQESSSNTGLLSTIQPPTPMPSTGTGDADMGVGTGAPPPANLNPAVATQPTDSNLRPSQFSSPTLSKEDAMAACGPAAAVAFAKANGRNPTLDEAVQMAKTVGWTSQAGMAGIDSQGKLLDKWNIPNEVVHGPVDWDRVQKEVAQGNPVTISTNAHYWTVLGYDPTSGKYNMGTSASDLKASGGNQNLTPDEMVHLSEGLQQGGGQVNGAIYTSRAPQPAASAPSAGPDLGHFQRQAIIEAKAAGIDPDIFTKQIQMESGFKTDSRSGAGARGIAQFMPATAEGVAKQLGVSIDEFWANPELQLKGAALYMKQALDRNGGDYAKALASYNAGQGNVDKYGGVPPFEETQRYIKGILGDTRPSNTAVPSSSEQPSTPQIEKGAFTDTLGDTVGQAAEHGGDLFSKWLQDRRSGAERLQQNISESGAIAGGLGTAVRGGMDVAAIPKNIVQTAIGGGNQEEGLNRIKSVMGAPDYGQPEIVKNVSDWTTDFVANLITDPLGVLGFQKAGVEAGAAKAADVVSAIERDAPAFLTKLMDAKELGGGQIPGGTDKVSQAMQDALGGIRNIYRPEEVGQNKVGAYLMSPDATFHEISTSHFAAARKVMGELGMPAIDPSGRYTDSLQAMGNEGVIRAFKTGSNVLHAEMWKPPTPQQAEALIKAAPDGLIWEVQHDPATNTYKFGDERDLMQYAQGKEAPAQSNISAARAGKFEEPDTLATRQGLSDQTRQFMQNTEQTPAVLKGRLDLLKESGYNLGSENTPVAEVSGLRWQLAHAKANELLDTFASQGIDVQGARAKLDAALAEGAKFSGGAPGDIHDLGAGTVGKELSKGQLQQTSAVPEIEPRNLTKAEARTLEANQPDPGSKYAQDFLQKTEAIPPSASKTDWLVGIRNADLLSGIPTLATITLSHGLEIPTKLARDFILGGGKGSGYEAQGALEGLRVGASAAGEILKSIFTGTANVTGPLAGTVYPSPLGAQEGLPGTLGKLLEVFPRLHSAISMLFMNSVYSMEASRALAVKGMAQGLKDEALSQFVREGMADMPKDVQDAALASAVRNSFKGEVPQWLNEQEGGVGRIAKVMISPYMRVMYNLGKMSLERSPLGVVGVGAKLATGKAVGREQAGDAVIGAILGIPLALMAAKGQISGDGPTDPRKRQELEREGWQPRSFHVQDKWISYANLHPTLAGTMGLMGDASDAILYNDDPNDAGQKMGLAARSLLRQAEETTVLQNLVDFSKLIQNPQADTLGQYVSGFIPYGTLGSNIANATGENEKKEVKGQFFAPIENRTPGLRSNLPPQRDVYGQPEPNPKGGLGALSPFKVTTDTGSNAVDQEIKRLNSMLDKDHQVALSEPQRSVGTHELTPEEFDTRAKMEGQNVKAALEQLLNSKMYQTAPNDFAKANLIRKEEADARKEGFAASGLERVPAETGAPLKYHGIKTAEEEDRIDKQVTRYKDWVSDGKPPAQKPSALTIREGQKYSNPDNYTSQYKKFLVQGAKSEKKFARTESLPFRAPQ